MKEHKKNLIQNPACVVWYENMITNTIFPKHFQEQCLILSKKKDKPKKSQAKKTLKIQQKLRFWQINFVRLPKKGPKKFGVQIPFTFKPGGA